MLIFRASMADSLPPLLRSDRRSLDCEGTSGSKISSDVAFHFESRPSSYYYDCLLTSGWHTSVRKVWSFLVIDRILYYPPRLHLIIIHREEVTGWLLNDWIFSAQEFEHTWHVQLFWICVVYIYLVEIPPPFFRICNQLTPRLSETWP